MTTTIVLYNGNLHIWEHDQALYTDEVILCTAESWDDARDAVMLYEITLNSYYSYQYEYRLQEIASPLQLPT